MCSCAVFMELGMSFAESSMSSLPLRTCYKSLEENLKKNFRISCIRYCLHCVEKQPKANAVHKLYVNVDFI